MISANSALSCILIDDLAISQLVLGSAARDVPSTLRDPTCERPYYHPVKEELALTPEEVSTIRLMDDWSEASSTSADPGDSSN